MNHADLVAHLVQEAREFVPDEMTDQALQRMVEHLLSQVEPAPNPVAELSQEELEACAAAGERVTQEFPDPPPEERFELLKQNEALRQEVSFWKAASDLTEAKLEGWRHLIRCPVYIEHSPMMPTLTIRYGAAVRRHFLALFEEELVQAGVYLAGRFEGLVPRVRRVAPGALLALLGRRDDWGMPLWVAHPDERDVKSDRTA